MAGKIIGRATDHHARFRPRIGGLKAGDAGDNLNIASGGLMDEMKRVVVTEDIAAGADVGERAGVVTRVAGQADIANVVVLPWRGQDRGRRVALQHKKGERPRCAQRRDAVVGHSDAHEIGAGGLRG